MMYGSSGLSLGEDNSWRWKSPAGTMMGMKSES